MNEASETLSGLFNQVCDIIVQMSFLTFDTGVLSDSYNKWSVNLKLLPERFVYMRVLTYSRECKWTLGGGPLERTYANCTHINVSLLKACDCGMDRVQRCHLLKKVHSRNCSFKNKFQNSASKGGKLDSRYSQVSLLTLCYHWQTLSKIIY